MPEGLASLLAVLADLRPYKLFLLFFCCIRAVSLLLKDVKLLIWYIIPHNFLHSVDHLVVCYV